MTIYRIFENNLCDEIYDLGFIESSIYLDYLYFYFVF